MTSSLVGSEMCIRDSPISMLQPLQWLAKKNTGGSPLMQQVVQGLQGGDAVSYTHLTLPTICSV
eukprot:5770136-Prorocentrum_lima.AAC.1